MTERERLRAEFAQSLRDTESRVAAEFGETREEFMKAIDVFVNGGDVVDERRATGRRRFDWPALLFAAVLLATFAWAA